MTRGLRQVAELLLALVLAGASSLAGAPSYLVGGVVVDSRSHAPLKNVLVSLAPTTGGDQRLEQLTKQDGRFSFVLSQVGKYHLQITKPGYPPQSYRQAVLAGVSSAIVVRDDQDTRHIVFEASRGSAISGEIKDQDSEPVGNAQVSIFQSLIVGGERKVIVRDQTRTNTAGEFRFSSLPGGNYYVCAMGRPWFADSLTQLEDLQESEPGNDQPTDPDQKLPKLEYSPDPSLHGTAFLTTFYPHAQTVGEASLVRLEAGGEAQVSITLPLTKAVSVKARIGVPGEASEGNANLLRKIYDQYVLFLEEWVPKGGEFQFKNVPAGTYEIVATSQSSAGASSWNIRQEVEVGASNIELTLRPPPLGSVSGRVLFEGEHPESMATLVVLLRNEKGEFVQSQIDPEGNFSFSRLPAGRYEMAAGSRDYVAAYVAGPTGERLQPTLEITSGEPIHRDLALTRPVSAIEGTVENSGSPQVGAFVLLMPKNPSERWAYRVDQTDSDGSFGLSTIPKGDYFLIALSDGTDVAYRDAKVAAILTKAAKAVHIEPGDHLDMKLDVVSTASLNLPSL